MALTFTQASKLLGNRDRKKLCHNTYLERRSNRTLAVVLHGTDVVTIHKSGKYTLNSGGWRTVTTKSRINRYSPVGVYQEGYEWYINDGTGRLYEDWTVVG